MSPEELRRLSRPELIERAEGVGIPRPKTLSNAELIDELITRSAPSGGVKRGLLGMARDLVASVVERGLHLPEAARVLRATQRRSPAPPPPLPTVTLAEIYAAQGYFGKAVRVLNEVLRREPEHPEAPALRARFAARMSEEEREELGLAEDGSKVASGATHQTSSEEPTSVETKGDGAQESLADAPPTAVEAGGHGEPTTTEASAPADDATGRAPATNDGANDGAKNRASDADAPEPVVVEVQAEAELEPREIALASSPTLPGLAGASAPAPALDPSVPVALEPGREEDGYDVDDVVGLAVDGHTVYAYWEVRAATFARARWRAGADARLVLRVLVAGRSGTMEVETRDVGVDELVGDTFVYGLPGGAEVRLAIGMRSEAEFVPLAVAPELSTPRALPAPAAAPWFAAPEPPAPVGRASAPFDPGAWAEVPRSRAGAPTVVHFAALDAPTADLHGGAFADDPPARTGTRPPARAPAVLVRRRLRVETVPRGGASDLIRRSVSDEAWRWVAGGASELVARGGASDLAGGDVASR
ncbi:MAG: DUF4912 domain-containing protein [Myxococcota bacterium]